MIIRNGEALGSVLHSAEPKAEAKPKRKSPVSQAKKADSKPANVLSVEDVAVESDSEDDKS